MQTCKETENIIIKDKDDIVREHLLRGDFKESDSLCKMYKDVAAM